MNKPLEAPCDQAGAKPDGHQANPPRRILMVEVLRATDSAREQLAPLPDWRSQPSAGGLRL